MSTICFFCGRMGHSEQDCNVVYVNPDKTVDRAYGAWLRDPTRNDNVYTGSMWLQNGSDETRAWTSTSVATGQSNIDQGKGGGQKDAKFMEIDVVTREVDADNNAITIKGRETWDTDMG